MVRYLIQLARKPADSHDPASSKLNIHERIMDLQHDANIDELYLLTVNRKGQVRTCVPIDPPFSPPFFTFIMECYIV